jgi:hypothetical protein
MAATVKSAICPCNKGWICEDHPDQPWGHDGCGAARVSFVQMCSVTKMPILFLNLFATAAQRNDLAVLSNSFDRGTAALLRRSPIVGNVL